MAIDNFDINIITSLMVISPTGFTRGENRFMHVQILRRAKDHPNTPASNKLIKSWVIRDYEHLKKIKEDVIFLCEHYKARAYISCSPKSIDKFNTLIMRKLADNLHMGNTINPWHVFNSACGELQGIEKRWVVDIDTKDPDTLERIKECIDKIWVKAHPADWGKWIGQTWWVKEITTLNGVHLITRPFDLKAFNEIFPDVEVKKNGLTALYVPDCITSNHPQI